MTKEEFEKFNRELEEIAEDAKRRGIEPLDTGGFTPFSYMAELIKLFSPVEPAAPAKVDGAWVN